MLQAKWQQLYETGQPGNSWLKYIMHSARGTCAAIYQSCVPPLQVNSLGGGEFEQGNYLIPFYKGNLFHQKCTTQMYTCSKNSPYKANLMPLPKSMLLAQGSNPPPTTNLGGWGRTVIGTLYNIPWYHSYSLESDNSQWIILYCQQQQQQQQQHVFIFIDNNCTCGCFTVHVAACSAQFC